MRETEDLLYDRLNELMPCGSVNKFTRTKDRAPWYIFFVLKQYVVFDSDQPWRIKELICPKRVLISHLKTVLISTDAPAQENPFVEVDNTESLRKKILAELDTIDYTALTSWQLVDKILREIAFFYLQVKIEGEEKLKRQSVPQSMQEFEISFA